MPAFTANRGYAKPTVGGDTNAWGTSLDGNFDLLDQNLSQAKTITFVNGTSSYTLTSADIANLWFKGTGSLTGNATVNLPAVGGFWFWKGAVAGGFNVTFQVTGAPGSTVTFVGSEATARFIVSDGTDVRGSA